MDLPHHLLTGCVAGVDEVGRGCLAGRVMAAAVVLGRDTPRKDLDDSKKIPPGRRLQLAQIIQDTALAWALGVADVGEIDQINILQASLLAMQRAVEELSVLPDIALIDGNICPKLHCKSIPVVRGDQYYDCIAAASILAKVSRDAEMLEYDALYPQYGFARNKGYGTKAHRQALLDYGVSPIHRHSFAPVREILQRL